jgi:hypothetical protein
MKAAGQTPSSGDTAIGGNCRGVNEFAPQVAHHQG